MRLNEIINDIKLYGENYCKSYMADKLTDEDKWSYEDAYGYVKECYQKYQLHPYNFSKESAFAKTYYEYDPEYYLGRNIEVLCIILSLLKLCKETGILYQAVS